MKPLVIELFAGTMSGTAGWCELGGRAVGFDLAYEPHHGTPHPLASRVIQDVLTLDGAQFKDADFLWGSSPCQAYSYLAMPWSRSKCPLCKGKKEYFAWQIENRPPANMADWGEPIACDCKENSAKAKELRRRWELDGPDNSLFDSVSRIAREASAAAGRIIPFVQENVRGAVPWVGKRDMSLERWKSLTQEQKIAAGRADAVFGSFFLWGNCGQIGKRVIAGRDLADIKAGRGRFGMGVAPEKSVKLGGGLSWSDFGKPVYKPFGFNVENEKKLAGPEKGAWDNNTPGRLRRDDSLNFGNGTKVPGQIQGKEYAMCRTGAEGQKTLGKEKQHEDLRRLQRDGSVGASLSGCEDVPMCAMPGAGIYDPKTDKGRAEEGQGELDGNRGNDALDVEPGSLIGPDGFGDEYAGTPEDGGFLVGMGHGGRAIKTPGRSLSKGAKNKFGTHNMGSAEKIAAELGLTNQAESDAVCNSPEISNENRDSPTDKDSLTVGTKQGGMGRGDWFSKEARADGASAKFSSKSNARKAASALIARIPEALSRYIAIQHWPG